jgi:DNA-binding CsgD family transcriptional regulator
MAFSENYTATNSSKSIDFKAVSLKLKDDKPIKPLSKIISEDTSYKSPKTSIAYFNVAGAQNAQNLHYEEFSYSNDELISSGSATISQKKEATHITATESLGASFGNGLYYGFALMVILLNLVCYFLFDEKVFLHYFLALTGIITTFFFVDGLFSLVGLEGLQSMVAIQSIFLLATASLSAWFATKYLNLHEFFPKLRWVSTSLLGATIIVVALAVVTKSELFATLANTMSMGIVVTYFMAGVFLFSKKNYAKFYVIATAIPVLFAIDFFVLKNFGFNFLATEAGHLKAATLVEMLVVTYAIMYRMRALKEENQLRQTELRIFLKRQEVMNRKNAAKLMEDVYLENLIMHYDLDGLEIKLLQYISEGKENSKIARKLKTTESEIEELTTELYHKLEISEHIQEDYRMVDNQPDYIYN